MPKPSWHLATLSENSFVRDAIASLNQSGLRIVLVLNENGHLMGTISDGDIRRALIIGVSLDDSIKGVLNLAPVTATPYSTREQIRDLMISSKLQQIPIVNQDKLLIGLHLWDEVNQSKQRENFMVIMAGGRGTRLMPFTKDTPKPLIEVAGRPILEHVIYKAKAEGFCRFVIAIYHFGDQIEKHLGNGEKLGVEIHYLREPKALGTAGALSLWTNPGNLPFVVTNGDVITDLRYGELLDFHLSNSGSATIATRNHEWEIPYGVIKSEGSRLVDYHEKPVTRFQINAGIYALNAETLKELKEGEHCDMPELIRRLTVGKKEVLVYSIGDLWFDIGNPQDLKSANYEYEEKNHNQF